MKLHHYSRQPGLTTLDPAYHGTGVPDAASRRKVNDSDDWVNRTYYYIGDPEPIVRAQCAYHYIAEVDCHTLYDLDIDSTNMRDTPDVTRMEHRIYTSGYNGFIVSHGPYHFAAMFIPLSVTEVPSD